MRDDQTVLQKKNFYWVDHAAPALAKIFVTLMLTRGVCGS